MSFSVCVSRQKNTTILLSILVLHVIHVFSSFWGAECVLKVCPNIAILFISVHEAFPKEGDFSTRLLRGKKIGLRLKILINSLQTKRKPLYLKPQSVPRCKHFSSRL